MRVMRVGGALTGIVMAALIGLALRRERGAERRKKPLEAGSRAL
jgi:hypothetical protein